MTAYISGNKQQTVEQLAAYVVALANQYIEQKGSFTLVLSGGSTPALLYETLAGNEYKNATDWQKVIFFFGDERYVPHTDDQSNFKMAVSTLLAPLQIPASNVFAFDTTLAPQESAIHYKQQLDAYFKTNKVVFDLVLLGLGDNVHTASLFPNTAILKDTIPDVKPVWLEDQQAWRLSLNAPLINQADQIAFLVCGADKAGAVDMVWNRRSDDCLQNPALLIDEDKASWFVDEAAAALAEQD
ncbi:MAG: 6-phosphogluconolactonase [Edaphocola sp.]